MPVGWFSRAPHSLQNFAPGGLSFPQPEHFALNFCPHSLQNLEPGGFSVWQEGQMIMGFNRCNAFKPQ